MSDDFAFPLRTLDPERLKIVVGTKIEYPLEKMDISISLTKLPQGELSESFTSIIEALKSLENNPYWFFTPDSLDESIDTVYNYLKVKVDPYNGKPWVGIFQDVESAARFIRGEGWASNFTPLKVNVPEDDAHVMKVYYPSHRDIVMPLPLEGDIYINVTMLPDERPSKSFRSIDAAVKSLYEDDRWRRHPVCPYSVDEDEIGEGRPSYPYSVDEERYQPTLQVYMVKSPGTGRQQTSVTTFNSIEKAIDQIERFGYEDSVWSNRRHL